MKLLRRIATMDEKSKAAGAPAAQMQKLAIPKKSKAFVDQTIREREEASRIHEVFQRDMFTLRLLTARAYAKMLDAANAPISLNSDEMLKVPKLRLHRYCKISSRRFQSPCTALGLYSK